MRASRPPLKVRWRLRAGAACTNSTVAMSILRMVKLFGWEPKIAERLAEKREHELQRIKLRQLLNLINTNIKWV
jgi:hypothetical protein